MLDILIKASAFILIIALGYFFKVREMISDDQGKAMSKVVMTITLPCALLLSARSISISLVLLVPTLIAILANFTMLTIGYFRGHRKEATAYSQEVIQLAGFNIGNFAFPFVQSFFPASYLMFLLLFDTGNAIMVFGGNVSVASFLSKVEGKMTLKMVLSKLFRSVPFCTYLLCFILSLFHLSLPSSILSIVKIGADANPFMAMFVLGVMVDFRIGKAELKELISLLALRFLGATLMVMLVYLLPIEQVVKEMLTICLIAPIAVVSPLFARDLGSKSAIPATLNSLSILMSICLMTGYLLWLSLIHI